MAGRLTVTTSFPRVILQQSPVIFKATSKLFGSQGCSDEKTWLDFSSVFFKICRFRSSILLSLEVFIQQGATLELGLTVARFFSTNRNSFATHSNQWNCFILDHVKCLFFRAKAGQRRGKRPASRYVEILWNKIGFSLLYKTNGLHIAVHLIQ